MAEQVVTQLTIDARGAQQGSAAYEGAMRAAQAASDRFLDRQRATTAAMEKGTMVMTSGSATISKLARDYERLQATIDPTTASLTRARRELEQTKLTADRAFTGLGRPLQEVNAVIDLATVRYGRLATAARQAAQEQVESARAIAQAQINASLGIKAPTAGSARASAEAFLSAAGGLEGVAAAKAREAATAFTSELDARLISGTAKSARDAASVFAAELDRVDDIARMKGAQAAQEFTRELDARLVQGTSKSARDAASVFAAEMDRVDDIARQKGAQAGQEFTRALNERLVAGSGKSASASASVFHQAAAEAEQEAGALRKLRAEINPLGEAIRVNTENHERYATALAAGHINQEQFNAGVAGSNRTFDLTKRSIDGANVAMGKYANGTGLARHELVNFSRQTQDVFVSLASGQGVMTVLIQQGTQIFDIFASSKGTFGGFLTQVPAMLAKWIPIIGVVSTAVAALYAAFEVSGQKSTLQKSLLGAGGASGLTGGQLEGLAQESAKAADITVTSSRLIAAEFVKLGAVASANLPRITQVVKQFSLATGQDMATSAKDLAAALADPSKASEMLSGKIGALDASTQAAIRSALNYNDVMKAQKYALEGVALAADGAEASMTKIERLKAGLGKAWDAGLQGLASVLVTDTVSQKRQEDLNGLLREKADLEKQATGIASQGRAARMSELDAAISGLQVQISGEKDLAGIRQKNSQQTRDIAKGDAETQKFITGQTVEDMTRSYSIADASIQALRAKIKDFSASPDTNQDELKGLREQLDIQERGLRRMITVTGDFQKLRAAGRKETDLDLDKSEQEIKIREKYMGQEGDIAKAAMARELAQNSLRGTMKDMQERTREAANEEQKLLSAGTIQRAERSVESKNTVRDLDAEAAATRRAGASEGERQRIRDQAAKDVKGTKEDTPDGRQIREMELLQEAQGRVRVETEANNSKQRDAIKIGQDVNAQAIARKMSEIEIGRQLDLQKQQQDLIVKLRSAGVPELEITKRVQELTAAKGQEVAIDKERAGLGIIYGQEQTIAGLEKEIALIGKSRDARAAEMEMLKAKQQLAQQGISEESDRGKDVIANTQKIIALNKTLSDQDRIQRQLRQSMDFAADGLKSFVEELLTGTDGINGALKSLGKGFLSASLDALISGKGPLAGITGLASNDNTKQGGILGLLSGQIQGLGKQVKDGAKAGSIDGVVTGIDIANANSSGIFGLNISGAQLAGGLTAVAGLAGAYGAGQSASSVGMGVAGGALSGAMAGAALGSVVPVIGTLIGAVAGAIAGGGLGFLGGSSASSAAKKKRQEEADANYKQAEPGIAVLRSQLRGEGQDTLQNRIKATLTEVQKGIDVSFFAKKTEEANALAGDFFKYRDKAIADFQRAFGGIVESMTDGLGPNSAFQSARDNIKQTGESLKGLVSDAAYAFGEGAAQIGQAREAAKTYALGILDGAKSLSQVGTRMEEIRGAGVSLVDLLVELGMAATDAAAAIEKDTIAALGRLKGAFTSDINSQINDAGGYGYVNEFNALFADIGSKLADAAALGLDSANINELFKLKAQEIVDGAQLTGSAFDNLIAGLPQLSGVITEFTNGLKGAAREADIAARRLNAQDRLFGATNDNSTLGGQLAAYNRAAMREREAEIKAGGEALVDLEQAQAAERYNIIRDWNQKALDDQKRVAEEARSYWQRFAKQISDYAADQRGGSQSPLSPSDRLAAAQARFASQYVLAQGGDRDAMGSITGDRDNLVDAAKAFYASSTNFQQIWSTTLTQLEALPDLVSDTQLIIDAIDAGAQATVDMLAIMKSSLEVAMNSGSAQQIAAALSTYFTQLDTNTSQSIDFNEMKTALRGMASESSLYSMFTRLDVDGSGSLDKLELIKTATGTIRPGIDTTNTSLLALAQISNATQGTANQVALVNANTAAMLSDLSTVRLYTTSYLGFLATISDQSIRSANNLASANSRFYAQGNSAAVQGYAGGGYVSGAGSSTSDSINARLSDGEYVMRAAAVDRFGVGALDQMNDNLRMPAVAMPVMAAGGGQSNAAMLAELRAMRREIAELKAEMARNTNVTAAAGEQVAAHVDGVTSAVKDGSRDKDLLAA